MKVPQKIFAIVAGVGLIAMPLIAISNSQDPQEPHLQKTNQEQGLHVGDVVDMENVKLVNKPGIYGLAPPESGHYYAVIDGSLTRIDPDTGKVLSILRRIEVADN